MWNRESEQCRAARLVAGVAGRQERLRARVQHTRPAQRLLNRREFYQRPMGNKGRRKLVRQCRDSPSSLDTHTKPSSVACAARSACQVGLPDLLRPFDSGSMAKLEKWWSGCWRRKLDRLSLTPLQALRPPPSPPRRKFKWSSASVVGCRENKEENNFHPLSHALRTLQFCLCLESTRRTHRAVGHCMVSRGPSTPTLFLPSLQAWPRTRRLQACSLGNI